MELYEKALWVVCKALAEKGDEFSASEWQTYFLVGEGKIYSNAFTEAVVRYHVLWKEKDSDVNQTRDFFLDQAKPDEVVPVANVSVQVFHHALLLSIEDTYTVHEVDKNEQKKKKYIVTSYNEYVRQAADSLGEVVS